MIQKLKKWTGDVNYNYTKALDKACFVHNVVYANSKDLSRRTTSEKILKDRAFEIAINPKYNLSKRSSDSSVFFW